MTTKRVLVTVIVVSLIFVGLTVNMIFQPKSSVSKANFDRIQIGMTKEEVDKIFNWGKGEWSESSFGEAKQDVAKEDVVAGCVAWGGDDGIATVIFDLRGRLVHKEWTDRPLTFLQKLRRSLPF